MTASKALARAHALVSGPGIMPGQLRQSVFIVYNLFKITQWTRPGPSRAIACALFLP